MAIVPKRPVHRFTCRHCGLEATPEQRYVSEAKPPAGIDRAYPKFDTAVFVCSHCGRATVSLTQIGRLSSEGDHDIWQPNTMAWTHWVYPMGRVGKGFAHVPAPYHRDYSDACKVFGVSAPAAACMARRCLQGMLDDQGYKGGDLSRQIDALLNESDPKRALSQSLHDTVDAIRQFGNFGAHPINDVTTLQLLEVEDGEAEWCISICEELMEHFYEAPAKRAARVAAANAKLASGGKKPLKS